MPETSIHALNPCQSVNFLEPTEFLFPQSFFSTWQRSRQLSLLDPARPAEP
jgi:hypothetical protein